MTAFLFPGQGSQAPGMGATLYDASPEARALFDEADAVLGFALTGLMFGEEADALRPTDITQPALYVHSLAANAALAARAAHASTTASRPSPRRRCASVTTSVAASVRVTVARRSAR